MEQAPVWVTAVVLSENLTLSFHATLPNETTPQPAPGYVETTGICILPPTWLGEANSRGVGKYISWGNSVNTQRLLL